MKIDVFDAIVLTGLAFLVFAFWQLNSLCGWFSLATVLIIIGLVAGSAGGKGGGK